jgi:hypoxanthine phosphoribosyltransferase
MKILIEGIKYNNDTDQFDFIWTKDTPSDLIDLKLQKHNKVLSTKNGNKVYYAYKFNKVQDKEKTQLRSSIKYLDDKINKRDIDTMLSKAINNFNSIEPISNFDIIITPKSSSKILDELKNKLQAKAGNNVLLSSDIFVKNTIDNIKFDEDKIDKLSNENKIKIKKILNKVFSKEDYKLRSLPPQYRKYVLNFMKFNSEADKRLINAIINGRVLIVDDIVTEGTTIRNMVALLNSIGVEDVVSFALLANK